MVVLGQEKNHNMFLSPCWSDFLLLRFPHLFSCLLNPLNPVYRQLRESAYNLAARYTGRWHVQFLYKHYDATMTLSLILIDLQHYNMPLGHWAYCRACSIRCLDAYNQAKQVNFIGNSWVNFVIFLCQNGTEEVNFQWMTTTENEMNVSDYYYKMILSWK